MAAVLHAAPRHTALQGSTTTRRAGIVRNSVKQFPAALFGECVVSVPKPHAFVVQRVMPALSSFVLLLTSSHAT